MERMTENKIRILEPVIADQIAAGEVVERPASVIKELVENSIDAGATKVRVEIDGGGVNRIRVADNGAGIPREEAPLAFKRHATSKIARLEDLEAVRTFGFRGEALPSIASVSRVTLRTRTADDVAGTVLTLEGGVPGGVRDAGCPVGTDIEVADLFFNTPARLKFMKKESTESGHCAEALVRIALIRPAVSFTFTTQGRKTRDLPRVERPGERVAALFPGESLAISESDRDGIGVLAILGPPQRAKAGAGSLYTYVNGRFVRDRAILRAVTQAFAGTLEPGRYPVGYISMTLPPGSFDVNVHPQKTEVRFADPSAVYRALTRGVGEMVSSSVWSIGAPSREEPLTNSGVAEEPIEYRRESADRPLIAPPSTSAPGSHIPSGERAPLPSSGIGGPVRREAVPQRPLREGPEGKFSAMRYIGQAKGTFLVLEDDDDLVLLDQHAAHERVTFERLRRQLAAGGISSQRLLMPHAVDLGPAETERIEELEERLGSLGLDISRAGPDRIAIHSVPAELAGASPDRLLADMVLALESSREGSRGDTDDGVLATMACHTSIRAGRAVDPREVESLLKEMDEIDFAGHCPHGRPVLARITWNEIRRRVGRE